MIADLTCQRDVCLGELIIIKIRIETLDASLAVPALDQAMEAKVALTLNGKPLEVTLAVDSPKKALQGETFGLKVAVASEFLTAAIDGAVQQRPAPQTGSPP